MTKQEVVEKTGRNIYAIWLEMAMRHFYEEEPEQGFKVAEIFVKELLLQEPGF